MAQIASTRWLWCFLRDSFVTTFTIFRVSLHLGAKYEVKRQVLCFSFTTISCSFHLHLFFSFVFFFLQQLFAARLLCSTHLSTIIPSFSTFSFRSLFFSFLIIWLGASSWIANETNGTKKMPKKYRMKKFFMFHWKIKMTYWSINWHGF